MKNYLDRELYVCVFFVVFVFFVVVVVILITVVIIYLVSIFCLGETGAKYHSRTKVARLPGVVGVGMIDTESRQQRGRC